jgi:hypothetical protein
MECLGGQQLAALHLGPGGALEPAHRIAGTKNIDWSNPMTLHPLTVARTKPFLACITAACTAAMLSACGGGGSAGAPALPQLAAAQPGTLANCTSLTGFTFANTTITSASLMAADAARRV